MPRACSRRSGQKPGRGGWFAPQGRLLMSAQQSSGPSELPGWRIDDLRPLPTHQLDAAQPSALHGR